MNAILANIARFAAERPDQIAIADGIISLNYLQLWQEVDRVAGTLRHDRIGLLLSNGCAWAVADLAILQRGATCIPMPTFFSDDQLRHLIADAGVEMIITDQTVRAMTLVDSPLISELNIAGSNLDGLALNPPETRDLPPQTAKITYTSGTTGQPKGVCLTDQTIQRVTIALGEAVAAGTSDKSLTLLPLSTLLANIAGIYAPLYSGGTAYVPDLASCGMNGSTGIRPALLLATLNQYQPTVTVLVPQLVKILVAAAMQGINLPPSLRYAAAGGAPVSPALLQRARSLGLPVYQGYGLSEAASVVSVNVPGQDSINSVGKPLPHVKIRIAADGEILVSGNLFSGYLGQAAQQHTEWATGDTGFLDDNGYLHVTGRKKTSFATAHGRKLAPEWIESELTGHDTIAQAALFGEGRSFNVAVIVPVNERAALEVGTIVERLNRTLPDYARVTDWIIADEPFTTRNGLASAAGIINRQAVTNKYADRIERIYDSREKIHAVL